MKKNIKHAVKRIGILGGTFDPPHKGHLHIAKDSLQKLKLNKILWVLTNKNPLKKKPYLQLKERIKLSKKITKNHNKILVKYFENKVKSTSTYDLLKYIKKQNKRSKLFFLIGADNLKSLNKWKNWKKIPNLAKIIVFPRERYSLNRTKFKKIYKKDIIYIKAKKINISSSLIRKFW